MKSLEAIQKEYKKYQQKRKEIITPEELVACAEVKKDDIDDDIYDATKAIRSNNRQLRRMRIVSYLIPFFSDDLEYYEEDIKLLQDALGVASKWGEYLTTLEEEVKQENMPEWAKLLDFTIDYYDENIEHIRARRNDLDLAFRGIQSFNPKYEDSRESFNQFFTDRIEKLSPKIAVQKTKEM